MMANTELSNCTELDINWNPRFLHDSSSSIYFNVYGGIDHINDCRNDYFNLTSVLFKDDERGRQPGAVKYFEVLLNGALNLIEFQDGQKIELEYPRLDKLFTSMPVEPEVFQIKSINCEEFNKTEAVARPAIFSLVDEKIAHIVQVASLGKNFVNFFKILETIKADKEAADSGFQLSDEELDEQKRFDYTANSPAVIGIHARHGVNEGKFKLSKTLTPMSLQEAHHYVSTIFIRYINTKYRAYQNWT